MGGHKINSETGELRKSAWDEEYDDTDETTVYFDGQDVAERGGLENDNPWLKSSYAHNIWLDGFLSLDEDDDSEEDDLDEDEDWDDDFEEE